MPSHASIGLKPTPVPYGGRPSCRTGSWIHPWRTKKICTECASHEVQGAEPEVLRLRSIFNPLDSSMGFPLPLIPHPSEIHETGACEEKTPTPFSSAKGHFDPGPFGSSIPVEANHPYHLGDLPNITVDQNGRGVLKTVTSRFSLSSSPVTLFDRDESAVILHKLIDQGKPGGTAAEAGGGRLACGVIEAVKDEECRLCNLFKP